MAKILLKFKGALIKEYPLDRPSIRIGRRDDNDIRIDNLAVSGYHAKIQKVDDGYIIVDLKSTNGTFVNRKKILQARLHHLDEITIGKHTLIFEDETQPRREARPLQEGDTLKEISPGEETTPKKVVPQAPTAKIQFIHPPDHPEVSLEKKLTIIGRRDDADIRLKGPFAPKVAAFISRKPSGYTILPEEKAKVKVNGELITHQTDLSDGDVIETGSLKLLFVGPSS